jgi:hypothetical protein
MVVECDSKGFSSLSELNRHVGAVHTLHTIFCPITGCARSESAPVKKSFNRKDHLNEHMRRKHPEFKDSTTASPSRSSSPQNHSPGSSPPTIPLSTNPKRKRRESIDNEERSQLTKKLRDAQEKIRTLKAENLKLRDPGNKELVELRARVKWFEDNNKLLTQVVDRISRDRA